MALWNRYASIAYLAVFMGVLGHASSEFASVLTGIAGPELSVWRFFLGGLGLIAMALILPASRNLLEPFKTHAIPLSSAAYVRDPNGINDLQGHQFFFVAKQV